MNKIKKDAKTPKITRDKIYFKNYNSFLYPDSNNKLSNLEEKILKENTYINIDSDYNFNIRQKDYINQTNEEIESFNETKVITYKDTEGNTIKDIVKYILAQFLSKLYPKCSINIGSISNLISKDFYSKNHFSNKNDFKIEKNINYFFNCRYEYKYSKVLKLNKLFFENCGKILIYIYSKLKLENIAETGGLKVYREKIYEENLNVLTDFYNYCDKTGYDPSELEKTFVWKQLENKYNIPPELIFLFNIFQEITTLDIELELACDILNEEDFSLFAITLLNSVYIFPKLDYLKFNLINSYLQYHIYEKYYTKIFKLLELGNEAIKKNNLNNEIWIYGNKWDFEHEFNLGNYIKKMNIDKRSKKIGKIYYDKYSILYKIEPINNIKTKTVKQNRNSSVIPNININNNNNLNKSIFNDFENIKKEQLNYSKNLGKSTINSLSNLSLEKPKDIYMFINNSNESKIALIYNAILLIICSFRKFKNFEFIINDCYTNELFYYLKEYLKVNIPEEYKSFHIFNLLFTQIKQVNLFNIELNSLNNNTFKKVMKIISKNDFLTSLKISFFSCKVSYLIFSLLKIYEREKSYEILEEYVSNRRNNITYEKIESKIVNDLSIYFIKNLNLLFQIIKNKINLEVLGFNFDIPSILINNKNYIVPIYKFIINILFLIDNLERYNKNTIEKLTILSKNTTFDDKNLNNNNNFFKRLQLYKTSRILKELNIQCQFYEIIHIKNLISTNLIILNIGDLDLKTFSNLVYYLTSYEFSSKSSLQSLNIKLMNKITEFNMTIKLLLQKLFYIKIKNLLELKLFSNIIIKDTFNYLHLFKFINFNWIPSYVITLNKISYLNKVDYYTKNLSFLIFPTIEKNSSNIFEIVKENKNKEDCSNDNELFWILKYIFICKYSSYNLTFLEIKNIIFNITKFIYPTHKVKFAYEINL